MSGWVWLCVRVCPGRWPRRYERELVALIEDTGLGWREGLDLIAVPRMAPDGAQHP